MGLDVVELVIRVEEEFALDLPDDECGQVRTVGDLYRLVLKKLNLDYLPAVEVERNPAPDRRKPWITASVWYTLKDIIVDQLQVNEDDIREDSTFLGDLGAD